MKKDVVLRIRVTREEYENLKEESKDTSLSDYGRRLLTSTQSELKFSKAEKKDFIMQLRKIGVNINQIAKKINGGIYTIEDKIFLNECIVQLLKLIQKINKEG